MKKFSIFLSLFLGLNLLFAAFGCQPDKNSPEAILKNVDAFQAMAIANEWKWSKKEIKSYVNPREVGNSRKLIGIPSPLPILKIKLP